MATDLHELAHQVAADRLAQLKRFAVDGAYHIDADVLEAVLSALYLQGRLDGARSFSESAIAALERAFPDGG